MNRSLPPKPATSNPVKWTLQNSRTKASTKLVLLALAAGTKHQKCISSVSITRLMTESGLSRTQIFSHLSTLRRLGEITQLGMDVRTANVRVYHLSKFCDSGSSGQVRLTGICCPYVRAFQRVRQTVRKTAYINTPKTTTIREAGLYDRSALPTTQPARCTPEALREFRKELVIREWTEPYDESHNLRCWEFADGFKPVRIEPLFEKRPPVAALSSDEMAEQFAEARQQIAWLGRNRDMATISPAMSEAELEARRRELRDQSDRIRREFPPGCPSLMTSATTPSHEPSQLTENA